MKKLLAKLKTPVIFLLLVAIAGIGVYVVAQNISDSYDDSTNIEANWRLDVSGGEIKLDKKECDNSDWFCIASTTCASDMDDGDYIIVYRSHESKTSLACAAPQCEGGNYVADNTVDFSGIPARDYCKSIGGRLPTFDEMVCIHNNIDDFGTASNWTSAYYYLSTSGGSNVYNVVSGSSASGVMYTSRPVLCVMGW